MVTFRYEISLLVFNSESHSSAVELNTRREIPYLPAPMNQSLFLGCEDHYNFYGASLYALCTRYELHNEKDSTE